MSTFSINISTSTQTSGYELGGTSSDLSNVILSELKDNNDYFISPESVRNAIFSLNVSYPFKETSTGNVPYIGIDTLNPNDRDLKDKKLFFGKRSYSGTYSYTDAQTINIMDSTLLSSDTDTFLYNTKSDTDSNDITKILIIAGTGYSSYQNSPYIQSEIVTGVTQSSTSLDFINVGDISVKSDFGTVSINDIPFPKVSDSQLGATDNATLIWIGGTGSTASTSWQPLSFPPLSELGGYLGVTGTPINFFGSPVYLNGYSLEFTDNRRVPIDLNDVNIGDSFSNYSISDLLKRIVFPYLAPEGEIEIIGTYSGGYAEVGTYPVPMVKWKIKKRTYPTQTTSLYNMIPGAYPAIGGTAEQTVEGTSMGIVISPITSDSTEFRITVTDGTQSGSASTYITGVYPYFFGYSNLSTMTNIGLGSLVKETSFQQDKELDLYGYGDYFYFIYDYDWGTISNVYDDMGITCSATFSYTDQLFSSPTGLWAGKRFYVYQWSSPPVFTGPAIYQFNF